MYSERVMVPLSLQKRILKEFHPRHPHIPRMKSLMRIYVYWHTIDRLVWLFGFYGISTFVFYLTPNLFLYKWSVLLKKKLSLA